MHINIQKALVIIRYWLLAKEYYKASHALELARKYHTGLRKDQKTPEIYHPLALVFYLKTIYKSLQYPEESIIVSLIHDLGEDYNILGEAINEQFGARICNAFSKITKKNFNMKKEINSYYVKMSEDPIASIVKVADRIHNHQSMIGVTSS